MKKRKLSEKELLIRKFRKFLYDNDALEEWTALQKKDTEFTLKQLYKQKPSSWISRAFIWNGVRKWSDLSIKWY
jgi:hypothetical protein